MNSHNLEVESSKEATDMIVTESDTLTYIHIREVANIGLITESKAQYQRIIDSQENRLIRVKRLDFPKVITQDARLVRYRFVTDLESLKIFHLALVNDWIMDGRVSYDLLDAAAKKFGMTYKQVYDSAYRFDDSAPLEQRHREVSEAAKMAIFNEVGSEG